MHDNFLSFPLPVVISTAGKLVSSLTVKGEARSSVDKNQAVQLFSNEEADKLKERQYLLMMHRPMRKEN